MDENREKETGQPVEKSVEQVRPAGLVKPDDASPQDEDVAELYISEAACW